jgi:hypothetical protein
MFAFPRDTAHLIPGSHDDLHVRRHRLAHGQRLERSLALLKLVDKLLVGGKVTGYDGDDVVPAGPSMEMLRMFTEAILTLK